MAKFVYRCSKCGGITEIDAKVGGAPSNVECGVCNSHMAHKIIVGANWIGCDGMYHRGG